MPKIIFRGKTYYSVYEMPPNIRRAYEKERGKTGVKTEKSESENESLPPVFEPEARVGMRGLVWGILAALVFAGIAYILSRFIP